MAHKPECLTEALSGPDRGRNAVIQLQVLRETVAVFYVGENMRDALRPVMESFFSAIRIAGPHLCQSEHPYLTEGML